MELVVTVSHGQIGELLGRVDVGVVCGGWVVVDEEDGDGEESLPRVGESTKLESESNALILELTEVAIEGGWTETDGGGLVEWMRVREESQGQTTMTR